MHVIKLFEITVCLAYVTFWDKYLYKVQVCLKVSYPEAWFASQFFCFVVERNRMPLACWKETGFKMWISSTRIQTKMEEPSLRESGRQGTSPTGA